MLIRELRKPRTESGAIAVLSLILFPLFAAAGLMLVDLSLRVLQENEIQQAADAAALAGVTALPARPAEAESIAEKVAHANVQIRDGEGRVSMTVPSNSNRLKVTISKKYRTLFGNYFGFAENEVTRSATAEYNPPIAMGSPGPTLGSDPEAPSPSNYFLHSQSKEAPKGHGDRYGSKSCDPVVEHPWAAGIAGTAATAPTSGCSDAGFEGNAEYDANRGYIYFVDVPPRPAGGYTADLLLEVFDPVFVNQGGQCAKVPVLTAEQINAIAALGMTDASRYQQRTVAGPTKWCSGDQLLDSSDETLGQRTSDWDVGGPPLTLTVFNPSDATPTDNFDGGYVGATLSTCQARTFNGYFNSAEEPGKPYSGTPFDLLVRSKAAIPDQASLDFAEGYQRWARFCKVPKDQVRPGRYIIAIRSDVRVSGGALIDGRPAFNPSGRFSTGNHFSLRANLGATSPVTVSALSRLPVFVNSGNSDPTTLYVARLRPNLAGVQISLELFDIGDAAQDTSLTVLPPADASVDEDGVRTPLSQFTSCTLAKDEPGPSERTQDFSPCGPMTFNRANDDARTSRITIQIPESYSCESSELSGCWLRVRMDPSGPEVHDATTWTLSRSGSPVRIISRNN